jgi:hypothetical protein
MDEDNENAPQFSEERWTSILGAMMDRARAKAGPSTLTPLSLLSSREQLRVVQDAWTQLVTSLYEVAEGPGRQQAAKLYQGIDKVDAGMANIFATLRDL